MLPVRDLDFGIPNPKTQGLDKKTFLNFKEALKKWQRSQTTIVRRYHMVPSCAEFFHKQIEHVYLNEGQLAAIWRRHKLHTFCPCPPGCHSAFGKLKWEPRG